MGFWEWKPAARIKAMRSGLLTLGQCMAWASRAPREVPLIEGEWEFIAMFTPEIAG